MLKDIEVADRIYKLSLAVANPDNLENQKAKNALVRIFSEDLKSYLPCYYNQEDTKKSNEEIKEHHLKQRWNLGSASLPFFYPVESEGTFGSLNKLNLGLFSEPIKKTGQPLDTSIQLDLNVSQSDNTIHQEKIVKASANSLFFNNERPVNNNGESRKKCSKSNDSSSHQENKSWEIPCWMYVPLFWPILIAYVLYKLIAESCCTTADVEGDLYLSI
ncbi:MAG: hypothetical protein H0U73_05255 [Tatlockia sp.]|nr:hypothetical protein [Tatlockia sp.]